MANETRTRMAQNFQRWKESPQSRFWVISHKGRWNHLDWLTLVDELMQSEYWPLDLIAVGKELAALRQMYANVVRWRSSGQPQSWVQARHGHWDHDDWEELLESLKSSAFWPMDPDAVGWTLEEVKREWANLCRWQSSGQPHLWVASHNGLWTSDDWQLLVETLQRSDYWPIDLVGVANTVARIQAAQRRVA